MAIQVLRPPGLLRDVNSRIMAGSSGCAGAMVKAIGSFEANE
jgi:hypothetical protein